VSSWTGLIPRARVPNQHIHRDVFGRKGALAHPRGADGQRLWGLVPFRDVTNWPLSPRHACHPRLGDSRRALAPAKLDGADNGLERNCWPLVRCRQCAARQPCHEIACECDTGSDLLEGNLPADRARYGKVVWNLYRLDGCPLPLDCGPVFPVEGAAPLDGVLPRPDWPLRPSVEDDAPPVF
jgi:hypothetical protein